MSKQLKRIDYRMINEYNITKETLVKETKKRKNWTAPRTAYIQNFLVEDVKKSKKGIEESIWMSQRQGRSNWIEKLLYHNIEEHIIKAPNKFAW